MNDHSDVLDELPKHHSALSRITFHTSACSPRADEITLIRSKLWELFSDIESLSLSVEVISLSADGPEDEVTCLGTLYRQKVAGVGFTIPIDIDQVGKVFVQPFGVDIDTLIAHSNEKGVPMATRNSGIMPRPTFEEERSKPAKKELNSVLFNEKVLAVMKKRGIKQYRMDDPWYRVLVSNIRRRCEDHQNITTGEDRMIPFELFARIVREEMPRTYSNIDRVYGVALKMISMGDAYWYGVKPRNPAGIVLRSTSKL